MKVFWSWQNDTPAEYGRNFIRAALTTALQEISLEHSLSEANRPEVDHDTKGVTGWVEIANTIFGKIDSAAVFVADVTPTIEAQALNKKAPNPNVMLELGYALKSVGSEPIVLIWNTASGVRPEELPFDMRHRRGPVSYDLPVNASDSKKRETAKSLVKDLKDILEPLLAKVLEKRNAALVFNLYPSRAGDPSIWVAPGERLEGYELWSGQGWKSFEVVESPRSYVRIAPYGWDREIPSRNDVTAICEGTWMLCPLFIPDDAGSGWAQNSLGIISIYDSEMPTAQTISATQWFEKTGEVWSFDAGVNMEEVGIRGLNGESVLKGWYAFIFYTLGFYKKIGKQFPIQFPVRIELGVVGIKNMCWERRDGTSGTAKLDSFIEVGLLRSLKADAIDTFISTAFNKLCAEFGQTSVTSDEFRAVVGIGAWDSEIYKDQA